VEGNKYSSTIITAFEDKLFESHTYLVVGISVLHGTVKSVEDMLHFIPEILQHPLATSVCSRKILHHFRMPQETYLDGQHLQQMSMKVNHQRPQDS